MWKYAVAVIGFLTMGMVFSNAFSRTGGSIADSGKPLPDLLQQAAEGLNAKRGESINGMVIEGATARGHTLVLDIVVPNAPKRINAIAAEKKATENMVSMYCNRKFEPLLKRGAVIVHRFKASSGLELVDGRLDAATCKMTG